MYDIFVFQNTFELFPLLLFNFTLCTFGLFLLINEKLTCLFTFSVVCKQNKKRSCHSSISSLKYDLLYWVAGLPAYLITYLLTYDLLMFVSFFIFLTVFKLHFFVFKCYPYDCVADHTGMFQLDDTISSPLLPLQFTPPDIPKRARIRRTIDFFI